MLLATKQAVPVSLCVVLRQIFCHRRSLDRDYQNRYSAMAEFYYTMIHAPASTTMEEIFIRALYRPFLQTETCEKSDYFLKGPASWNLASICIRL
jgi:hypothetical protein